MQGGWLKMHDDAVHLAIIIDSEHHFLHLTVFSQRFGFQHKKVELKFTVKFHTFPQLSWRHNSTANSCTKNTLCNFHVVKFKTGRLDLN